MSEARPALARRQEELIRALNHRGPAPARFDSARLQITSDSLLRKRMRAVQKLWPETSAALGETFSELFCAFSAEFPVPDDPDQDGFHLARWLKMRSRLPPEGQIELARWQVAHGALFRVLWLRKAKSFVVIHRWHDGVRYWRLGLPSRLRGTVPR